MSPVSPKLRSPPSSLSYDFSRFLPSDALRPTAVPMGKLPRPFYLAHFDREPGPIISSSPFVPAALIEHLMSAKRDSALGRKWVDAPESRITNMEGALHTFVTALLPVSLHGDTAYRGGHVVLKFVDVKGFQQARPVILSTQIRLDFEDRAVAAVFYGLEEAQVVGKPLAVDFRVLPAESKRSAPHRAAYDTLLKAHAIFHLTHDGTLPPSRQVQPMSAKVAIAILEAELLATEPLADLFRGQFVVTSAGTLSLEMMKESYLASLVNEFSVLELTPHPYTYLYNPPSIFARHLPAPLSTRLMLLALSQLSRANDLPKFQAFAIDTFADPPSLELARQALAHRSIDVLSRDELFSDEGHLRARFHGALVLHNLSDGFGQNVESEGPSSMDGVIGVYSSAAAGLRRDRVDLVAHLV